MKAVIHPGRIDFLFSVADEIHWQSLLDDLKAEPLPGFYQNEERMGAAILSCGLWAYIYRTEKTPAEQDIREILARHGFREFTAAGYEVA
ncbi:MAG TPA: hypothetical protein VJP87_00875 [Candidatus Acidoferrales bacterium]|nr:hypothetical protein [Candidatus Acidoferrales bacterium]